MNHRDRPSVRQLEYAVALARELHFGRAAEASMVTQPALSTQIQALEAQLGLRLFERDRRRVLLTPEGATLLEHARAALARLDDLLDAAEQLRGSGGATEPRQPRDEW